MKSEAILKENRIAYGIMLVAVLVAFVLLSLPLYNFETNLYRKRSANTFVDDEKYIEAKAEVDAIAAEYEAEGIDVEFNESISTRTNSRGKETSAVTFTLSQTLSKSPLDFFATDLPSGRLLRIITIFAALALITAAVGLAGTADHDKHRLARRPALLRSLSAIFGLGSTILIPPFVMSNNYELSRKVSLYNDELITEGKEAFFITLDRFFFNGNAGEMAAETLDGMVFTISNIIWIAMLAFFIMVLAGIFLRHGTVKQVFLRGLLYFFVIALSLFILYPYYVMTVTAFRSAAETNDMHFLNLFPVKWMWSNLQDIVKAGVPRYLLNSFLIAGGATIVALLCGIPAAYAMSRMRFKGKKIFLGFIIMSQMFSPVVLLIGIAQLIAALGLNDSIVGLMLIYAAFNQAFAIWLLRGTFMSISSEMEQAARIDGCNTMGSLIKVLLPMAAPGIVTTLIFVFINAWNEYTIATVLIKSATNRPITVGITQFSSFNMIEWHYLFAASLLATLPVVFLFMSIERHLTEGLTAGGVKG